MQKKPRKNAKALMPTQPLAVAKTIKKPGRPPRKSPQQPTIRSKASQTSPGIVAGGGRGRKPKKEKETEIEKEKEKANGRREKNMPYAERLFHDFAGGGTVMDAEGLEGLAKDIGIDMHTDVSR